jgi:type II secretory pathway component PulC
MTQGGRTLFGLLQRQIAGSPVGRLTSGSVLPMLEAVLVGAVAFGVVQYTWALLTPPSLAAASSAPQSLAGLSASGAARLTSVTRTPFTPNARFSEPALTVSLEGAAPVMGTAPAALASLRLAGVRTGARPSQGSAYIGVGDAAQRVVIVGDSPVEGVTLTAVHGDHVIVRHAGGSSRLSLPRAGASAPAPQPTGPETTFSLGAAGVQPTSTPVAGSAQLPAILVEQLGLSPVLRTGQPVAWQVSSNTLPAPLVEAGLAPGDIVTLVNDRAVPDLDGLLTNLRAAGGARLTVERDGEARTITLPLL